VNLVIELKPAKTYKLLSVKSDIVIENKTHKKVEIILKSKLNEQIILASQNIDTEECYYLPLGLDQSIAQFRYDGDQK
jgi:hypothetical protein